MLCLRADASTQMGTGHIMRCLALAQIWQAKGGQAFFVMATESPKLEERLHMEGFKVVHHHALLGSWEDGQQTISLAHKFQAKQIVLDGYHFGSSFQQQLKNAGFCVLCMDDNGHADHYYADWVLNQNIHAQEGMYSNREPYTKLLLGTQYILLRKEFCPWLGWQRQIVHKASKVLVTLGGSDPNNTTLTVLRALKHVTVSDLEAVVVVGSSNPHNGVLQEALHSVYPKVVDLRSNVDNMAELMVWADLAITAGGSTCWELSFMGLPSLVITVAENQVALVNQLENIGAVISLGKDTTLSDKSLASMLEQCLSNQKLRSDLSKRSSALVDGYGCERLILML
jgi:UDP-2,4-diacetamido-2,4,6-trideoxy-beta-L-altropyranose hydrolase